MRASRDPPGTARRRSAPHGSAAGPQKRHGATVRDKPWGYDIHIYNQYSYVYIYNQYSYVYIYINIYIYILYI